MESIESEYFAPNGSALGVHQRQYLMKDRTGSQVCGEASTTLGDEVSEARGKVHQNHNLAAARTQKKNHSKGGDLCVTPIVFGAAIK